MKKIVIIGGGFGGVYTARHLEKLFRVDPSVEITLINKTNYFLFTPLLHEVATGSLSARSVSEGLHQVFRNTDVNFLQAEVTQVDREAKKVYTSVGIREYDYLVVATGAETNFFGLENNGVLKLKTLADAKGIRDHVVDSLEKVAHEEDKKEIEKLMTFVVVGAGPTGIEFATELTEFVRDAISGRYSMCKKKAENVRVILVHSGGSILKQFSKYTQGYASCILKKKNIELRLNTKVVEMGKEGVVFLGGEKMPAHTVVWTAGVRAVPPGFLPEVAISKEGRVLVEDTLQLMGDENVFVLGDTAGQEVSAPMLAQVAVAQAKVVANNLYLKTQGKKLSIFTFKSRGMFISLGRWRAAGDIGKFNIQGPFAWWMWRTIYLFKFISWRKRVRIMFEWTYDMFSARDVTEV